MSRVKAAQFSGVSRIAFIDALAQAKRPAFHVDVDELMEEVERARKAIHGSHATRLPVIDDDFRLVD
jgi:Uncharacterised protein family (UPF0175)